MGGGAGGGGLGSDGDESAASFRIHPLTLQFADANEEARFRQVQMLSHLPLHFTLATSVIVLASIGSVMEPQLTDIYLWWLPFIFTKYPLLWWLTRDGGKHAHHANLLLGTNMFCGVVGAGAGGTAGPLRAAGCVGVQL